MSNDNDAAHRQQVADDILSIINLRTDSVETPITEAESRELLEKLQTSATHDGADVVQFRVDRVLRDLCYGWISELSITDPRFVQVWYLLDIATLLADNGYSDPASNFQLIENIMDSQTVSGCRRVFDYLESRRDKLIEHNFGSKHLIILRTCNELLRRLSRAEDTVFCGRVFIFLFQSFPLGDRSSVNLRGVFHTENVTTFDPDPKKSKDAIRPMELDSDRPTSSGGQTPASTVPDADTQQTGRSTPIPSKAKQATKASDEPPDLNTLFPKFWSMQALFSNPTRLFEASGMAHFKEAMTATLACFKSISGSSNASSSSPAPTRGTKRKRSGDGGRMAQTYNPKYLTNRDLFDLEVHDVAFRRHILAQCLIMLDFLLSLTPAAKTKWDAFPKDGKEKSLNKSVAYEFTLSEEETKQCQSMRQSIAAYLQQQGPGNDGKMYYRMVDTVLSRDKNWAVWKVGSCQPIGRKPVEADTYLASQKVLGELTEKKPFANRAGAGEFDFLSQSNSLDALKYPKERQRVPSAEEFYKAIEGAMLDEDFAADEDERAALKEKIQSNLWKALRASNLDGRRFALCEQIKDGTNLKALIGQEDAPSAVPTDAPAKDTEEAQAPGTNGEVRAEGESAADSPNVSASVPQLDRAGDVPDVAEAIPDQVVSAGVDEGQDNDFAPPGAMDLDEGETTGTMIDAEMPPVSEQLVAESSVEDPSEGAETGKEG